MNQLARDIRIPMSRVSLIVNGRRGIPPDTALRLGLYFEFFDHHGHIDFSNGVGR